MQIYLAPLQETPSSSSRCLLGKIRSPINPLYGNNSCHEILKVRSHYNRDTRPASVAQDLRADKIQILHPGVVLQMSEQLSTTQPRRQHEAAIGRSC